MTNKNELLNDVKKYLCLEEETIRKLSAFYKALMWKSVVKQEYHKDIEKNLHILKKDTVKHARMLKGMIEYIEHSNKDEF